MGSLRLRLALFSVLGLAAVATLAAAVIGGGDGPIPRTAAAGESYALQHMDREVFTRNSLAAEPWAGPRDGFLPEDRIREIASRHGEVLELALLRVSAGPPGDIGRFPIENHPEALEGPVWVVILADRHELSGPAPDDATYVNARFLSPRTGDVLFGLIAVLP